METRELTAPAPGLGIRRPLFWVLAALQLGVVLLVFLLESPAATLGGVFTLVFGALILLEPRMSLVAVTFITFTFNADYIEHGYLTRVFGFNLYAPDWVLIFAALSWFLRWSAAGGRVPWTRLTLPLLLFAAVLPVAVITGMRAGIPPQAALYDFRLFAYYLSFFLVIAFVRSPRDLELVFWSMLPFSLIGALQEIQWSLSHSMVDQVTGQSYQFGRITGTHEATYPVMVAACLVMFPFAGSVLKRTALSVSVAVSTVALALSYTRGSWLAAFAALGIVAVVMVLHGQSRTRSFTTVLFSGLSISGVLYLLDMAGVLSFNSLMLRSSLLMENKLDISSLSRLSEWQCVLSDWLEKPVLGVGFGHIYRYYSIGIGWKEQIFVHNSFLYVLSKTGVVGLLAFLHLLATAVWMFIRTISRMPPGPAMGTVYVYGAILLVFIFKSLTTWDLNALFLAQFVGVVMGAIAYLHRYYTVRES